MPNNRSHLTAIKRKTLSTPVRHLIENSLVTLDPSEKVLDYGCGRGDDAGTLGFDKFDPHYFPAVELPEAHWDMVVCNYVLNVNYKKDERRILDCILRCLKPGGVAYITVRRDVKREGYTSKGTYQRNVVLPYPKVRETAGFCIYGVRKEA